jgi:16S rRNA (cytosine967-C5)-methyltransferase
MLNPKSTRKYALEILLDVDDGTARANDLIDQTIRKHGFTEQDRSFLTELVYGTIRWQGNLDWVMAQFITPAKLRKTQPEILEILRLGIYQLLHLKGVADYAAVSESVELAKKYGNQGASGFVNAILRNVIRNIDKIPYPDINKNAVKHIAVRYSHPEWMVKRWLDRYGVEQTIALCSANNFRPSLYMRTNTLKASRQQLIDSLEEDGVSASPSQHIPESVEVTELNFSLDKLSSYTQGLFQVQDESSMLIGHILDPKPGETVVDACAAPGGKSTHIAELMQNKGKVMSFDTDGRRLNMLNESSQRLGISIIETIEGDARNIGHNLKSEVDRILVDAPCTGLGVLRRRVEARWRRTPEQIMEFSELQYEMLEGVSNFVKTDGVLVYCTCTIEPEENQQVVEKFLETHPEFQLQSVLPFLPEVINLGDIVSKEGYLQTYPHLHNMDGIFAAKMIRINPA